MRRPPSAALPAAMLAVAIAAAACSNGGGGRGDAAPDTCADPEAPITQGPRAGAVTTESATIWVRACRGVQFSVQYQPAGAGWSSPVSTETVATDPAADNSAVVPLSGLSAATPYEYRIVIAGRPPDTADAGSFRTMPESGGSRVSFVVGMDPHPEGQPIPAYDALRRQGADFALLVGDLIDIEPFDAVAYATATPTPAAPGLADYQRRYRSVWGDPFLRGLMSSTATYLMWDDHEILNDWDAGDAPPYPWARAAFDAYMGSANPAPVRAGEAYYTFRAGDAEFFVLDTRSHRSPEEPGEEIETMLGLTQLADLKRWLLDSDAKMKFIVSSVMVGFPKHGEDSWNNYRIERDELFQFISDQKVRGVILLSGDEHWPAVFRLAPWNIHEFAATPLGGFPSLPTLLADSQVLYRFGWVHVFGRFDIDTTACPATVTGRIIDVDGTERFAVTLSELDLLPSSVVAPDPAAFCAAQQAGAGDSDGDGCGDAQELGDDPVRGGGRDPASRWDFYDVNTDGRVDTTDAAAVAAKVGTRIGDLAYDPAFDRSPPAGGADPWDAGPPDGVITDDDFFLAVEQNGHACR